MIQSSVYARVGLVGNPSDGFYGKTISACVKNWQAAVTIENDDEIVIVPNIKMDALNYDSLADLVDHADKYGYYGALRLVNATCSLFSKLTGIVTSGFRINYTSSIPRQVGLGGSSALVVALLNCLIEFHAYDKWSLADRANVAWAVENDELLITSGLQDRVIQTYGGLVYMEFNKDLMDKQGYGYYEEMEVSLPKAFIAYTQNPKKNSGQMHNPIKYRFNSGDIAVIYAMKHFANLAQDGYDAILGQRLVDLAQLMKINWQLRRKLYGDEAIGQDNIKMIMIANKHGCPAKLPGSGGAIIGLYNDDDQYDSLRLEYEANDYEIVKVIWDQ